MGNTVRRGFMSATEGNSGDHHASGPGGHHGPPPPPEPKTPMWLPAVGVVLFLTVGLVWGLGGSSKDATEGTAPAATTSAAADAGAAPAPRH